MNAFLMLNGTAINEGWVGGGTLSSHGCQELKFWCDRALPQMETT